MPKGIEKCIFLLRASTELLFLQKKMSICAILKPISILSCLFSNNTVFHQAHT